MKFLLLLTLVLAGCASTQKPKQPDVWTSTKQLEKSRQQAARDLEELTRALDEANQHLNKAENEKQK